MDRRMKKTREAVFAGFRRLLGKKSYSKITVQDIIDEADIGRSTFYAHFETKDALLEAMCTEIFLHVFNRKLSSESTHDFSREPGDPKAMMTHILYHFRDLSSFLPGLADAGEFWRAFRRYFSDFVEEIFSIPLEVPRDFFLHQASGAFMEMIRWWMEKDFQRSPEELMENFLFLHPYL